VSFDTLLKLRAVLDAFDNNRVLIPLWRDPLRSLSTELSAQYFCGILI